MDMFQSKELESLYNQCKKFSQRIAEKEIFNVTPDVYRPLEIDKASAKWREYVVEVQFYADHHPESATAQKLLKLTESRKIDAKVIDDMKVDITTLEFESRSAQAAPSEAVAAKAAENYGINISGTVNHLQIQQGANNTIQQLSAKEVDYSELEKFLNQLARHGITEEDFGEHTEQTRQVVTELETAVARKEAPSKIKGLLLTLKDLAIGAAGSLIAAGIQSQIPLLLMSLGL